MVKRKNQTNTFPETKIAPELGGGFKYVLCSPLFGEMIRMGWNDQLVKIDGRKMNFPSWGPAYFQRRTASF